MFQDDLRLDHPEVFLDLIVGNLQVELNESFIVDLYQLFGLDPVRILVKSGRGVCNELKVNTS